IDDNTKLFYSIDIENEVAMETGSSFLGFHAFESVFTVTDPVGLVKSNWYDAGRKATVIDNGNNTVTVTTVGVAEYPYDQSIYTTPAVNGITGTDIAFNFNVKLADNNVGDQPVTFNYGIFGGGQINLTFYYQGSGEARGWTNAVIGGTNFIAPEVTMITYKAGVQKYQAGPSADLSFAAMFASIAESGLKTLATEEGHEFTVRATATETGALLRIYYGATCEKTNLFYSLDIECEDAKAVENSFIGFRAYDNVATVSSAKVFIPKEEEGEEENESIWTLINENEDTAVDYSSWDNANLAGSVTIDDKNASTNGFWKPQLIAKFADLYDGEMSAEYDYAVTATVKANGIGNQNTTETQFWFYYYVNSTNYFGSAFQYVAQWYNAFAYGIENNAALEAASVNGKGNTAKGSSVQIEKTALPLAGLLTGTAGRERTFTTVYSVIEGKGVWIRIYLNSGEGFDHTAVTPVFQAMLYTKNTDVWNVVDAYFGFRFFNADVTISNIEVTHVTKSTEGIVSGATVNGDLGAWKENESLPAVYTVNGDAITVDDTKSSPVSYGEPGLTVAFDALAGEKDYKAEKDFVVGFDVVLAEGEREMSLWLDIIDAKNNYIGIGLFHQNISNEYVWTNNAILSNAGNPISGYTYEGYGKTSVEFENKAYTFEGVMAVPSVAGLKDWGDETGHRFYVRYTVMEETVGEGEEQTTSYRLVIRLYYDYGT
ncbi:MAG: hypothetical protein IJR61_01355, partial [Clostridia bacterium]|nr:hypothetical protein [Clostridia bacterium]